jgi:hypothetical protein
MSKIRSDILYQRRIKEVNQADQQMRRLHIATPITNDNDFNNPDKEVQNVNKEDLITVSDDEFDNGNNKETREKDEVEPNTEENENQWNAVISQWIEEANYENRVENSNDELLLNGDFDNDFLVGARNIHPADDQSAKWELSLLFTINLEPPTYSGFFSDNND